MQLENVQQAQQSDLPPVPHARRGVKATAAPAVVAWSGDPPDMRSSGLGSSRQPSPPTADDGEEAGGATITVSSTLALDASEAIRVAADLDGGVWKPPGTATGVAASTGELQLSRCDDDASPAEEDAAAAPAGVAAAAATGDVTALLAADGDAASKKHDRQTGRYDSAPPMSSISVDATVRFVKAASAQQRVQTAVSLSTRSAIGISSSTRPAAAGAPGVRARAAGSEIAVASRRWSVVASAAEREATHQRAFAGSRRPAPR